MDSKRKIISTAALVAFLIACGSGPGGRQAIADVTDAMFNALVARVTTNESAIATLQDVQAPNLVDVNGTVVGPILGRGNGGTAIVEVTINGLPYVASFGPGGTWYPKITYYNDPGCSSSPVWIDAREVEAGFDYVWAFTRPDSVTAWRSIEPVRSDAIILVGWRKDGRGFCEGIQSPRLKFYSSQVIGGSADVYTPPFSIE